MSCSTANIARASVLGVLCIGVVSCNDSDLAYLGAAFVDDTQASTLLGRMYDHGTWQPEKVFSVTAMAPVPFVGADDDSTKTSINTAAQAALKSCMVQNATVTVTVTTDQETSYLSEMTPPSELWTWGANSACCNATKANSDACPGRVIVGLYQTQWTSTVTTTSTVNGTVTCENDPGIVLMNMGNGELKATSTGWNVVQLQDLGEVCRQSH